MTLRQENKRLYWAWKSIKHVETGKVFNSVREAADYVGLAPCTISNAMRRGQATGKGSFEWVETIVTE